MRSVGDSAALDDAGSTGGVSACATTGARAELGTTKLDAGADAWALAATRFGDDSGNRCCAILAGIVVFGVGAGGCEAATLFGFFPFELASGGADTFRGEAGATGT